MAHPFSLSCATLGQIKTGFLVGFPQKILLMNIPRVVLRSYLVTAVSKYSPTHLNFEVVSCVLKRKRQENSRPD